MSYLGLHRHQVKLSRHSTKWRALGEQAVAKLIALCGQPALHVEHAGSTSVADLDAKRILDLVVGLEDVCRFDNLRSTLVSAHYIYRGFQHGGIGHLFVRESAPGVRTIRAHGVPYPSTDWNEYVCFRDLLKAKKIVKRDYPKLKQASATRFSLDRKAYTASKHEFIQGVLRTMTDCYQAD